MSTFPQPDHVGLPKSAWRTRMRCKCYDWFFCTKKLDKQKILDTILKK
jgi:hypothetical protein